MKILWHSNAPWAYTGYGQQTSIVTPRLMSMGYEILLTAFYGLQGSPMMYNGIPVFPNWAHLYGDDVIDQRYIREEADLLITLMDIWVLSPDKLRGLNVAHWMPVDCEPLGAMDRMCLSMSGATPIAMSQHGVRMLEDAGFDNVLYVPHCVDVGIFRPLPDDERQRLREANDLDDMFVIGINAANKDPVRKGMAQQMEAFSMLYKKHDDARLLIHAISEKDQGLDLHSIARYYGIEQAIKTVDVYNYISGKITANHLANWYNMLDLYSGCSLGEGFGIPIVEAEACGLPVVVTNASSMPEVAGPAGWKVNGEHFWNPKHEANWVQPNVQGIYKVYEEAYAKGKAYHSRKAKARTHAMNYSVDNVMTKYWTPAMRELELMVEKNRSYNAA